MSPRRRKEDADVFAPLGGGAVLSGRPQPIPANTGTRQPMPTDFVRRTVCSTMCVIRITTRATFPAAR